MQQSEYGQIYETALANDGLRMPFDAQSEATAMQHRLHRWRRKHDDAGRYNNIVISKVTEETKTFLIFRVMRARAGMTDLAGNPINNLELMPEGKPEKVEMPDIDIPFDLGDFNGS